ncbi:MAG TPA: cytoplasmic protein [Myxococcales bacterium]|nr:cytoplasmic protein [Myxococcales bacterium]
MNSNEMSPEQVEIDVANLHREETFTDMKVGTLRRLVPVLPDGNPDPKRPTLFFGQTHVMTRAGVVPVEFAIEAASLQEAADKFPAAMQKALDEMLAEVQAMQRERASGLIIPGAGPGKIQMP